MRWCGGVLSSILWGKFRYGSGGEARNVGRRSPAIEDGVALYAVFGQPIAHSLSPVLHNAAFRVERPGCFYIPVEVRPEELADKLAAFRALGGRGVNLTRPLKELVMPMLHGVSEWAGRVGAANTLAWRESGGWWGDNTDVKALLRCLPPAADDARPALVLGSGGAARASVAALEARGYAVTVAARTPGAVGWHPRVMAWDRAADPEHIWAVVVNATPRGQIGEPGWDRFPLMGPGTVVVDWVYRPQDTPLLREARRCGSETVDGLTLLVEQAALAWTGWFGREGPAEVMRQAVEPWITL